MNVETSESERLLVGTRVFGSLNAEKLQKVVAPFLGRAIQFGPCMVVTQPDYVYREDLHRLAKEFKVQVKEASDRSWKNISPARMCNVIRMEAKRRKIPYFAIVSNDLYPALPTTLPKMIDLIQADPQIAYVGVHIEGVHDMELVGSILRGENKLTADNYPLLMPNNAFCVRRTSILDALGKPLKETRQFFSRSSDDRRFGELPDGLSIGGNEEMLHILNLISLGFWPKVIMLSGEHSLKRDPNMATETPGKLARRKAVVKFYQERVAEVSNKVLQEWLDQFVTWVTD